MEKEFSVEGITNINDVARFSLKLDFLIHSVQRHKEIRETSHKEFVRRMNNVMVRRRFLLEKRQNRQSLTKLKEVTYVTPAIESDVTKLDGVLGGASKAKTIGNRHGLNGADRNRATPNRYYTRTPGTGRRNFRRISLTVGSALRISSARRPPAEARLYAGKVDTRVSEDKLRWSTSEFSDSSGSAVGYNKDGSRSKTTQHVGRIEPHLAVTRRTLVSTRSGRDKVKDMLTRIKVVKRFQNNLQK